MGAKVKDINHVFIVLLSKLLRNESFSALTDTHYNERLVVRTVLPGL